MKFKRCVPMCQQVGNSVRARVEMKFVGNFEEIEGLVQFACAAIEAVRVRRAAIEVNLHSQKERRIFSRQREGATGVVNDDIVTLWTQYSTQWDALAHVGQNFDADGDGVPEPVYYNGFRGGSDVIGPDDTDGPAARALGIENMAESCVQGRGVMVDLHARFGAERKLVGYDDLLTTMDSDGVVVEEGDMLCLHTGYADAILNMGGNPDPKVLHHGFAVLNGRDDRLLKWLDDSGIAVLIADNYAVEQVQGPLSGCAHCAAMPLHQACLFRLGIHLGELWHLTPLNSWLKMNKRFRFLLTAPPLRLTGSFGSPVTPVATV